MSERLKELGVKQDSYFFWHKGAQKWYVDKSLADRFPEDKKSISAFTVAELGEVLPSSIKTDYGSLNYLHIAKLENTKEWLIAYFRDEIRGSTEADARAKMLIWLIKNKLVEVNK